MSTLDRLRALVKGTGPGTAASASAGAGTARVRELTYEPVGDDGLPLIDAPLSASLVGAKEIDGPLGKTLVVERHYSPADWHGSLQLRDARVTLDDVALIARDPAATDAPRARILYLDLETTGLSGGAGTVAFLVGCALSREDGSFEIRQFVLPSFAAERALIGAVTEWARAEAAVLVTYNGRTFDVPVMETRWAFHRLRSPWDELPHLDMLHIARRLWSKKHARDPESSPWAATARASAAMGLHGRGSAYDDASATAGKDDGGCRLVTLERILFEVERVGDVPGFEIPARYFDFVRRGDWSVLEPVLHHNRLDLLSLAGVTARAARLLRAGVAACTRAEEAALLGREFHRRSEAPGAEACYRRGLDDLAARHPLRAETLAGLARLLRSQRRYDEAAAHWTEITTLAAARTGLRQEATEALAVHFEHRRRDLERAHAWAERARRADVTRTGATRLDRRLDRLRRKLSGASPGGETVEASQGPGLF
jgi:uncharacterized protein YprB with RNaseH-like and TPR domain